MRNAWLPPSVANAPDSAGAGPRRYLSVLLRPRVLQPLLDIVMAALVVVTFLQLGQPDLMFHIVWLFLALHAFAFGLRSTLIRIGLATTALIIYALLNAYGVLASELELIEWPLMFMIAVLVAVMADQVKTASQRYARLYRLAQDRLLTAQEAERSRLALDLHDGVGQTLSALALTLEVASQRPNGTETRERALQRGRELVALATDETRDVAQRLRPPRIEKIGLAAAVRELARGTGLPARVRVERSFSNRDVPPELAVGVYRIVQEALANAARHADARTVTVTISKAADELIITIKDDGQGFDLREVGERGLGLPGMRERASMLRGSVDLWSKPTRGTVVRISVPLGASSRLPMGADVVAPGLAPSEVA